MKYPFKSLKLVVVDSSAELISAADGSWSIEVRSRELYVES